MKNSPAISALEALDTLDVSISLLNLLRSTSADMIVELNGEGGLHTVLELVVTRLAVAKSYIEDIRSASR